MQIYRMDSDKEKMVSVLAVVTSNFVITSSENFMF